MCGGDFVAAHAGQAAKPPHGERAADAGQAAKPPHGERAADAGQAAKPPQWILARTSQNDRLPRLRYG
jgi:hypothetical protein